MMKVFVLLVLVGLAVVGWQNRENLPAFLRGAPPAGEESPEPSHDPDALPPAPARSAGTPTPHPAHEATETARKTYPALGIKGSTFNKKFIAFYTEAQRLEPEVLARPDWPLKLAGKTAVALGGAPMPTPTPPQALRPLEVKGAVMDRPVGK